MSKKKAKAQLLVEGKNDQHVIWALCQEHKPLANTFVAWLKRLFRNEN